MFGGVDERFLTSPTAPTPRRRTNSWAFLIVSVVIRQFKASTIIQIKPRNAKSKTRVTTHAYLACVRPARVGDARATQTRCLARSARARNETLFETHKRKSALFFV